MFIYCKVKDFKAVIKSACIYRSELMFEEFNVLWNKVKDFKALIESICIEREREKWIDVWGI